MQQQYSLVWFGKIENHFRLVSFLTIQFAKARTQTWNACLLDRLRFVSRQDIFAFIVFILRNLIRTSNDIRFSFRSFSIFVCFSSAFSRSIHTRILNAIFMSTLLASILLAKSPASISFDICLRRNKNKWSVVNFGAKAIFVFVFLLFFSLFVWLPPISLHFFSSLFRFCHFLRLPTSRTLFENSTIVSFLCRG